MRTLWIVLLCVGMVVPVLAEQTPPAAGSFEIQAFAFDRGNAATFTTQYVDDGRAMIANGGQTPWVVEYDVNFPVDAVYTIHFLYTAQSSRPVDLSIDGKGLGCCCDSTTGTWSTSGAKWEQAQEVEIRAGGHTIELKCGGPPPHIVAMRFDSDVPFPPDWALERPNARKVDSPPPVLANSPYAPDAVKIDAVRMAIEDLIATFGPSYPNGAAYLARLAALADESKRLQGETSRGVADVVERQTEVNQRLADLRAEALLSNPLLDFDQLLLVKRTNGSPSLGLPRNWQSNCSLPNSGFDDEIAVLSPVGTSGAVTPLFHPEEGRFVGDVDLSYDSDRMLFSMVGSNGRWQICEINADGSGLRELTGEQPDVDSYDACYLPNGKIAFTSTAYFVGVPCVYGSAHVAVLYVMDADGGNIRQLCFDQEHDWCPTVMNNGRLLYSRWEYTDTPHSNTRLLFHMNPDGTEQFEFYGSNSYWPNSFFYARPVPNHPTKVVAVIGGHHDNPRMGELVVFDPALGRHEATGAVQRIPGHGETVEMIILDGLTSNSWPKFLHPYPLSEKHILVASKPTPRSEWGIYLVDTFDNMVLIHETPGAALLEPIPFRPVSPPPVIPEKVNLAKKDAIVYLPDIYAGDGLKGIPRGTVKSLRIFTYHYAYQGMGGLLGVVGMDGPWDIKRVVGTVPVHADGSTKFRVPANLPISLQPLDSEGKAVQLMRSWMTAMPGEVVQCTGCHERQNTAPIAAETMAVNRPPSEIEPWHGAMRGFSYEREVQPVIDRHCIGCHDGSPRDDGLNVPNLRGDVRISDWQLITPGNGGARGGKFSVGYYEMTRYVRRPGIESDYHMLEPMEYHADTTQLVQTLAKGHHGVRLDDESWDRLITWIDLNCPYHGTWGEDIQDPGVQRQRRRELVNLYGGYDDDPEAIPAVSDEPITPIIPSPLAMVGPESIDCPGWPFNAEEAARRQAAAGPTAQRVIPLAEGVEIRLSLIPAGQFVMGSNRGEPNQRPLALATIDRPFWMAELEITNAQFALFDPAHDSRVETKNAYQFGIHGYPMNEPYQPVVRVSWDEAAAFCRWLSKTSGEHFSLPTEAQWEYACRAGSSEEMSYGAVDEDFSRFANMSDATMIKFVTNPYTVDSALANPPKYDDWIPKDTRYDDGSLLSVAPGSYKANAWGLFDMHGNVAEWTASAYRPHPSAPTSDDTAESGRHVVRGGSWRDRPARCTSSFRWGYQPYQRVYNVGFRVICPARPPAVARVGD